MLISLAMLVLSIFVLVSNFRKAINIVFSLLTITMILWIVSNGLIDGASSLELSLFWMRVTFISTALSASLLLLFSQIFPYSKNPMNKKWMFVMALLSSIMVGLLLTNFIVSGVEKVGEIANTTFGPGIYLYGAYMLIYFSLALGYLLFKYINSNRRYKKQLQLVFLGFAITVIISLTTNLLLPMFFAYNLLVNIGPLSLIIFLALTSYSIINHGLLDIRFVVARSLAYIILLAMLAAIYAGSVLGLERIFFPTEYNNFSFAQGALRTVVTVAMVFLFQPLKRWVTKATDKVFFKNSYDKDDLLSELSHTLGSTIVLIEMLYRVSDLLTSEMKASRTLFALVKDENRLYTVQANGYKMTPEVDPLDVLHITKDGVMVADELEDNSSHKRLLREYDAAIAIPLKTDKEVVGVLLLGEKSSGDMYSQQDLSVLEIIAPEIAVAIENAKSYEEINRFNVTLRQEVKRATYRLKEKNTQLMELDHAKDEFISMASHQLRTPLTAIKGYLSMLLEGDAGDIKVSQYDFINEAYSGANRMVGLINDLLNVSRMETGRFFLEPKELDIERVVEEEVKQLTNAAKTKGLYLKIEKKGRVPHIWADETKIRQVVMNFMDNAIYYTNTGGVTVVLRHDSKNFIYEVHDTGIGVPSAQRDHMFEKFFRADNARTARPDGTGLGIYLAKRVISDHGGEIIFDSVEGKGSVFGFKFPLKKKIGVKPISAPEARPAVPTPEMPMATEVAEKNTTK